MRFFIAILLVAFVFFDNAVCSEPDNVSPGNAEHEQHAPEPDPIKQEKDQRLPSRDELLNMLDSMDGLSDEEKDSLRQDLLRGMENDHQVPSGKKAGLEIEQTLLLFGLLGSLAFVLVFFTYKLYKNLTEKERRRLEKKLLKESKKKRS